MKCVVLCALYGGLKALYSSIAIGGEQLDTDGYRLLHHAAVMSDLEDMSLLLDLSASIEVMDGLGKTALHIAARRLNSEGVALLLSLGADPNSRETLAQPLCTTLS